MIYNVFIPFSLSGGFAVILFLLSLILPPPKGYRTLGEEGESLIGQIGGIGLIGRMGWNWSDSDIMGRLRRYYGEVSVRFQSASNEVPMRFRWK